MWRNGSAAEAAELKFLLVTSPSQHILMHDRALTRGQARRLSRRFGDVGVAIPATRLRQISAGARAALGRTGAVDFSVAPPQDHSPKRPAQPKSTQHPPP